MPRTFGRIVLGSVAATVLALLPSCSGQDVPRPRLPQVEQAREAVQGGGERYRDHRECMQSSSSAQDLIRCMGAADWQFVVRGTVFPAPECWEARERDELARLAPHCFTRADEQR